MPSNTPPLVLIVDDDTVSNNMLKVILTKAGLSTVSSFDAAGGLRAVTEHRPDLVLLDVNLPDGNGLDVCAELQRRTGNPPPPVLFISAEKDMSTKLKGFEAGGVDYISKPIFGPEVTARVNTHLRLKQTSEALAGLQAERIARLTAAQETLMPKPADLPAARFQVSLTQVLQAGGDFYDVFPCGPGVTDYLVADASGHDLAASLWTAALKALISQYAGPETSPAQTLSHINAVLCKMLPPGVFFTLIYARLDRGTGTLTLVNAGHPPAIVVSKDGKEATIVRQEGDVAGSFRDAVFDAAELRVSPGSRIFLYTDGLIETSSSRGDNIRAITGACAALAGAPLGTAVTSAVRAATRGKDAQDDILLMGVDV